MPNVEYADEDIGSNCGSYECLNGEVINEQVGDAAFACALKGIPYSLCPGCQQMRAWFDNETEAMCENCLDDQVTLEKPEEE